jgi:DNA-binding NtrC family response regulator
MARVLVVDDERQFAETLAERLRTRGMEVHTAYDGASAVEVVRQSHPDVVLLDLSMPGMDGLAALKAIKELVPRTEVVLLTAESVGRPITSSNLRLWSASSKPSRRQKPTALMPRSASAWRKRPGWRPWENSPSA